MPITAKRILIVRPTALGDVARSVPVLATLRQTHPDAQIDWLVHETFCPVIANHPQLNGVVPFARKRHGQGWYNPKALADLVCWCRQLQKARYDLVVDQQGLLRSGLLTWITRAPKRLGFANGREFSHLAYTDKFVVDRQLHTVDRMLGLLQAAGYQPVSDITLYTSEKDTQWYLAQYQKRIGSSPDAQPYALLAPTARWLCKCWPIEKYAQVAQRLQKQMCVLAICAPGERQQLSALEKVIGSESIWANQTVGQMMAAIEQAKIVVCNDSAPLHIAVGLKRPIACIFGPTDPRRVGPFNRPETVIQPANITPTQMKRYRRQRHRQSLISQVPVDAVWQVIEQQLHV